MNRYWCIFRLSGMVKNSNQMDREAGVGLWISVDNGMWAHFVSERA